MRVSVTLLNTRCVCCYLVVFVCMYVCLFVCLILCGIRFQDAGDFAAVAYIVLRNRCPERGK